MSRNVAASVRARLTNEARKSGRPFQEVLQYFGLERFLYRFSRTPHRDRFLLKGALMLRVWDAPESRPTRDIDLLGYVHNDIATLETIVRAACIAQVEDDGLVFDPATVAGERIKEDAEYHGVRIKFMGLLEKARVPMQIDVGFGDVVHPAAEEADYPTILDHPSPRLRMYPRTTVVAEKLEAMVYLGRLNSRMKDFFDIWLLARQFNFSGPDLAAAIAKTFANRGTGLVAEPVALTGEFTDSENAKKQWAAFIRRSKLQSAPRHLDEVRAPLREFLLPVTGALVDGTDFQQLWPAGGPWRA